MHKFAIVGMALLAVLASCGGVPTSAPATPATPAQPVQLAPLAAWPLDAQSGSVAIERLSGRADSVNYVFKRARFQASSDPLWRNPASCIKGGCLLFDGYSTDVVAPGLSAAKIEGGFTLSAWVAPHAFEWGDGNQYSAVLSQFDRDARAGFAFGVYRFGTWGVQMGFGDTVTDFRVTSRRLPKDTWSHIAMSYDAASGQVSLFLNGEQVLKQAAPGRFIAANRSLSIGRHSQPVLLASVFQLNTFLGLIDEVRIGAGAASAADIARDMADDLAARGGKVPALAYADMVVPAAVLEADRYRPQYHAIPDSGWMNEPHAPFYYKGQYHLFFQKNPFGPFWHQIHWGHWISSDMVHWRELPIALAPEDDGLAPDGIWSGSAAIAADGTPTLFFTAGNDSVAIHERTGMATPLDLNDPELRQWTKYPVPVTLQQSGPGFTGDFRDPFVFRAADGKRWFQLVASRIPGGSGTALVHESADLKNWTYRGPLFTVDPVKYPLFTRTFELPVLLPVGKGADGRARHVFLNDVGAQAYYWIGVFDEAAARFLPDSEAPRVFDLGEGHFSGPSGFVDPGGRSIVFSIAQGERTSQGEWDSGWAHNAGLPITLSLGADGDLRLAPIAELNSLRTRALLTLRDVTPAAAAAALAGVEGDGLEIELELAPAKGVAARRGLVLRKSPDNAEHTDLYVDSAAKRFEIDRRRTTLDREMRSTGVQGGAFDAGADNLRLRVFLDRSMVEAYLNDRKSLTSRVFPSRLDATGVALMADPADRVVALTVWAMGPSRVSSATVK